MAVEIALLQKFGVFLGHPNYALSVVLAALLLSTGAGALASGALVRALGRLRFASYALAFVLLAAHLVVFPRLLGWVGPPLRASARRSCSPSSRRWACCSGSSCPGASTA